MLFVSQTALQVTVCESLRFAKEVVDLNKLQTASQVTICEGLRFAKEVVDLNKSQTSSQVTICEGLRFAKEVVDMNKSQTSSQVTICEVCASHICIFIDMLFYGDSTRGTRGRSQLQK